MKSFRKYVEEKKINEDDTWWNSQTKEFQDKYIQEHPNSKYAKNSSAKKDDFWNKRANKPQSIGKATKDVVDHIAKQRAEAKPQKIDTTKMSVKEKGDTFVKMLDKPGKYWVGQVVNPDKAPDWVMTDNDGVVIGFDPEFDDKNQIEKMAKTSKEVTDIDRANNKELEKWLGSKDYDEYVNKPKSKKYYVGQSVDPDDENLPDDLLVDNDGKVIGFQKPGISRPGTKKEKAKEYSKETVNRKLSSMEDSKKALSAKDYNTLSKSSNFRDGTFERSRLDAEYAKSDQATPEFLHKYIQKPISQMKRDLKTGTNIGRNALANAYNNPNLSQKDKKEIENLLAQEKSMFGSDGMLQYQTKTYKNSQKKSSEA